MANNEDYLNNLIAKAKKSWEGVDVDSFMSDLRDDTFDKEVAENLSKEVASYITEQMKSNMDKATIKCRALMVGDWITNRNGFPMQITNVGEDYAYATFEGNEGDPWEFDDKGDQPQPIPLTAEILEKNGFGMFKYDRWVQYYRIFGNSVIPFVLYSTIGGEMLSQEVDIFSTSTNTNCGIDVNYVHEIQHALRLCRLNELADNFKV